MQYNLKYRGDCMFEIRNQQKSNKTIRMPNDLIDRLQKIADQNNISFNQLVV